MRRLRSRHLRHKFLPGTRFSTSHISPRWAGYRPHSNNTLSSKDVTFTIFNRRGEALNLGVITLEPGGRAFKFEELIKDARKFGSGNIKLEYEGQQNQVRCQLGVVWPEKRISFESRVSTPKDFRSSQLNGIAWFPDRGSEAS